MYSWFAISRNVLTKPPHVDVIIPKDMAPDPKEEGIKETIGEPQGQIQDYELTLQDGRRIHIRKFEKFYKAHWDKFSPIINAFEHLRYDAPHWWVSLCALGFAILGFLVYGVVGAALGGLIGFFIGAVTLPQGK